MSLYNMLFGENKLANILLAVLGTNRTKVPRYRDCYISDNRIAIHTRTGGGNRDHYESRERYIENEGNEPAADQAFNEDLRTIPGFLYDEDDDFDSTYATFYFSFPEEYKEQLEAIGRGDETIPPNEKWQLLFKSFETQGTSHE